MFSLFWVLHTIIDNDSFLKFEKLFRELFTNDIYEPNISDKYYFVNGE